MKAPIKKPETLSCLCIALLRDCQEDLQSSHALDDEPLVHDLRVSTKRLRAAWHLVKELSGSKSARKRRKALRMLSAHLSSRRDIAVLEELARNMADSCEDPGSARVFVGIEESIQRQPTHSEAQPCPEGLFEEVRECIREEIAAWEAIDWSHSGKSRKAIRRALRKATSEARKKTRKALKDDSAGVWHEWRKAIKRLRYQREFVAEASGRRPGKFDARVSALGTALGDRNDLANLQVYGEQMGKSGEFGKDEIKILRKEMAIAEKALLANCRRLGRRFLKA